MTQSARLIIDELALVPHPEGGYYRETYRSSTGSGRPALTSIYYALLAGTFSALHRIDADEAWHHYRGDDVHLVTIADDGVLREQVLGSGGPWQTVVPAGIWFAAESRGPAGYALVGCDVAPGFDFDGFEIGEREHLLPRYPQHGATIARFTRPAGEAVTRG